MSEEGISKIKFIDKDRRRIEIILGGLSVEFPLNAIPDPVYEALADLVNKSSSSSETINELQIGTLTKPSVASLNASNIFPINSARKVIRLTQTDEVLEDSIDEFEGSELALQGRPFEDTLDERIDLYQKMMLDDRKIDRFRLGAVEMYGDKTYQNIRRDPRVTLNMYWTEDNNRVARSFQLNCIAEIIPPGGPFYRYMRIMRRLFSTTLIDTDRRSTDYICAYKFWVCEAKDKSLAAKPGFVPD